MEDVKESQFTEKQPATPVVDPIQDGDSEVTSDSESAELNRKLGESLSDIAQRGGVTSWAAKRMAGIGRWLEREVDHRKQTIGGIDNMWLLMSDATDCDFNPVCACTSTLRGALTVDMLVEATEKIYPKFPKYRQRLTSTGRMFHGSRFEDDPDFNTRDHIHTTQLPEPAGKEELEALMGKFIAQGWDLNKPLWEMLIVENYHDDDGATCALVVRGHHTLADGQGFVISQLYMTSYHDELIELMSVKPKKRSKSHGNVLPSSVHPALRPLDPLANPAHVFFAPLVQLFLAFIICSGYGFAFLAYFCFSTYHLLWDVVLFLLTSWRIEMLTADQPGPRTTHREFASSNTVSMADVRLCQTAFSGSHPGSERDGKASSRMHVTVNDVMCSVMSDVLGEEIKTKANHGLCGKIRKVLNKVLPSPIAFFIPISVRTAGDWSMRNLCTGWLVYLSPMNATPVVPKLYKHIHTCRSSLAGLKHSLWPRIFYHIVQATGQAPAMWPVPFGLTGRHIIRERAVIPVIKFVLQSFPVILTNVPGPAKKPVQLAGIEIIRWAALPPQAGKGTLGMGIISYAGGMSISVAADCVPGSEGVARRICTRFEARFKEYVYAAKEVLSEVKAE